jgi:hypothetical protein
MTGKVNASLTSEVENKPHDLGQFKRQKRRSNLAHHGSLRLLLILKQMQLAVQQRFDGGDCITSLHNVTCPRHLILDFVQFKPGCNSCYLRVWGPDDACDVVACEMLAVAGGAARGRISRCTCATRRCSYDGSETASAISYIVSMLRGCKVKCKL